ncbi:MAG: PAS domain-containing protein, partial [Pseudomonadota bacterium]
MTLDSLQKHLLDNLTTGVIALDDDLHLRYINLAAESLLALSGRQIMGAPLGDLIIDGEQD